MFWGGFCTLLVLSISQDAPGPSRLPAPFSEEQISRTIARIQYLDDGLVVKFGLKHLDQILAKMNLSNRDDLKDALVRVMGSDPEVHKTISYDLRLSAGKALGRSKLVERATNELSNFLGGKEVDVAKAALVEYATTTKTNPSESLIGSLKTLKAYPTLVEIALQTADKPLISFLVDLSKTENNFDRLYGLDGDDAAQEVIKHYASQLEVPKVPSDLTVTQLTYRSVQLAWKDNSLNESGFLIERAIGDGGFTQLTRTDPNIIYYVDDNLEPSTTYLYKVRSFNWNAEILDTTSVSITTPSKPDPLPDPLPVTPQAPASPAANLSFLDLTKKMRIDIGGIAHSGIIEALIATLQKGPSPVDVAMQIGKLLEASFSKPLFDKNALSTSLALRAIDALKTRASYEEFNMNYLENIRKDNAKKLRANAATMEKKLLVDLETTTSP